jgi:hypothetical protein
MAKNNLEDILNMAPNYLAGRDILRLSRLPEVDKNGSVQGGVRNCGIDTIRRDQLPDFLRDKIRWAVRWEGGGRAAEHLRHYAKHLKAQGSVDEKTLANFEVAAQKIGDPSLTLAEQQEIYETEVDTYLTSLRQAPTQPEGGFHGE